VGDARSVIVTGASRGLGMATAAHLYAQGWTVVAAMRSPAAGLEHLRAATGAGADDPRLIGIRLDLDDAASITAAAAEVHDSVGAPYGVVHNAGVAGVGCLEELSTDVWDQIFSTNFFGAVRLTRALLPDMRAAGRGRIVMVSSMGALRGMPAIGAYSAAKAALERWAESLSFEVAPFGLGVTVLVAGTFKTDILELTPTYADPAGPYDEFHEDLERRGRRFVRFAAAPARFAPAVATALEDGRPFVRRTVGIDARLLRLGTRLLPGGLIHRVTATVLGLPRPGAYVGTPRQRARVTAGGDA